MYDNQLVSSFFLTIRQYSVYMVAVGTEYGNSEPSNSLLISTPGSRYCTGQLLDSSIVDFESWEASDQTDLKVKHVYTAEYNLCLVSQRSNVVVQFPDSFKSSYRLDNENRLGL